MTKDQLEEELVKVFKKSNSDVYLFYAGHTHANKSGNWNIDLIDSHNNNISNDSVGWLCKLWKN